MQDGASIGSHGRAQASGLWPVNSSPFFLIGLLLTPIINVALRIGLQRSEVFSRYARYREAVELFHRQQEEFWGNLSGHEFEAEFAALFRRFGYAAQVAPASGDRGVDINLNKSGRRIIVQCKQHRSPAGPSVVRELLGTLVAERADRAVLACTGGFTRGALEAALGKPIMLLNLEAILELQRRATKSSAQTPEELSPLDQLGV